MERSAVDLLTRIADDRRKRVAEMRERVPGHLLKSRLGSISPAGRLERALRRSGPQGPLRLVCEIKRASPSRGLLHPVDDPVAIARAFQAGGASAISIVTEPDHFDGRLEWLDLVRPAVTLPLLLKDFVVDSYQLMDAAVRGADAVLLIAALQSEGQLQRWITEARLLGMDCLVEVHDEDELRHSIRAGATLVGINNRDLRTFQVDLGTSTRLLPSVPPMVTAVSESGIAAAEDLARLRATRCDAALMGEVLMTSADPQGTLAGLLAAAHG